MLTGKIRYNQNGDPVGIEIQIDKFSQFQIIVLKDQTTASPPASDPAGSIVTPLPSPPVPPVSPSAELEIILEEDGENELVNKTTRKEGEQEIMQIELVGDKVKEILQADPRKKDLALKISLGKGAEQKKDGVTIHIPGDLVKTVEERQGRIMIDTEDAIWQITAAHIRIESHFGRLVPLKDVTLNISIIKSAPDKEAAQKDQAAKQNISLLGPTYEFGITVSLGAAKRPISEFTGYSGIFIRIPAGTSITTGVLIKEDGTIIHVPTKITIIDGIYYAQLAVTK